LVKEPKLTIIPMRPEERKGKKEREEDGAIPGTNRKRKWGRGKKKGGGVISRSSFPQNGRKVHACDILP